MALIALCAIAFLPGVASLPPIDRDEARFAQASRQMAQDGDYVDIRFQDEPRYKKPVGIYWLQAVAVRLLGDADAARIWPFRIPSLIGAALAVLLTAAAGRRLFGATAGWTAASLLAASAMLGVEARLATTDAVLLATIVAAQTALAEAYLAGSARAARFWSVFWIALALGVLVKGPVILAVSGCTILGLIGVDRRAGWLLRLRPLYGVPLMLAIVAPWGVAITLASGGDFLRTSLGHELLDRLVVVQESHGGPPGYHLATFLVGFWPFAPLAALALPWVWRQRRDAPVRFCLAWIVPYWILVEIVSTKLPHYALPYYPAVALLTARALREPLDIAASKLRLWLWPAAGATLVVGVLLGVGVAALPWRLEERADPVAIAAGIVIAAAAIAGCVLVARGRRLDAALVLGVGAVIGCGLVYQGVLPRSGPLWVSQRVAEAVQTHRRCRDGPVAAAGYEEPSLVFLLGRGTRLVGAGAAAEHLLGGRGCALVAQAERPQFVAALTAAGGAAAELAHVSGLNYSKGRMETLTLYGPEPGTPAP